MAGKLKLQTVSRAGLTPLVDMAEFLRSFMPGWEDTRPLEGRARVPSVLGADLDHLARVDSDGFLAGELERRRALGYPPYSHLIRIILAAEEAPRAQAAAR